MIRADQNSPAANSLHWYSSTLLKVPNAMLCRFGGSSTPPFAELNLSYGVGDDPAAVEHNRQLLKQQFGIKYLVSAVQTHGKKVVIAENIRQDCEFSDADALITRQQGVGLLIQQADCQAILLHDPVKDVIAAVHSGWRGSVLNIACQTVTMMQEKYGVRPMDVMAVISPSLGPCCAEFTNYRLELPQAFHEYQITPNHFDFQAISRNQLHEAGLQKKHIDICRICTLCNTNFFSYRRSVRNENGVTGRNGSIITL